MSDTGAMSTVPLPELPRTVYSRNSGEFGPLFDTLMLHQYAMRYAAAVEAAAIERCRAACEAIADEYQRKEGMKYPELKSDAQTGASDCEAAIRALGQKPT